MFESENSFHYFNKPEQASAVFGGILGLSVGVVIDIRSGQPAANIDSQITMLQNQIVNVDQLQNDLNISPTKIQAAVQQFIQQDITSKQNQINILIDSKPSSPDFITEFDIASGAMLVGAFVPAMMIMATRYALFKRRLNINRRKETKKQNEIAQFNELFKKTPFKNM